MKLLHSGCFPRVGRANIASLLILTWDLSESQHLNNLLNTEPSEVLAHGNPSVLLWP